MFIGAWNVEEFLDWIEALNNYFECREVPEHKRVTFAKSKMKRASLTWWNFLQGDRVKEGGNMITSRERMSARVKTHFVPANYDVQIYN